MARIGGAGVDPAAAAGGGNAVVASGVATSETTASTAYIDLTTAGPSVTLTTGTTALVFLSARTSSNQAANENFVAVAVSGATTLAAADANGGCIEAHDTDPLSMVVTKVVYLTGLTAGVNTFKMQYRVSGGTGTYAARAIGVVAL
jgi:hypothetical protein